MSKAVFKSIVATHYKNGETTVMYEDAVNRCPYCQFSMSLKPLCANYSGVVNEKLPKEDSLFIFYQCERDDCQKCFVAVFDYYYVECKEPYKMNFLSRLIPSLPDKKDWPKQVNEVSPRFKEFYDQAAAAEYYGLTDACASSYRNSLEFLVKDYSIILHRDKAEEIKNCCLCKCIEDFIADENIRFCAKRSSWIRNEASDYLRRWEFKDIKDLKKLIQLTVNHIQTTLLSSQ